MTDRTFVAWRWYRSTRATSRLIGYEWPGWVSRDTTASLAGRGGGQGRQYQPCICIYICICMYIELSPSSQPSPQLLSTTIHHDHHHIQIRASLPPSSLLSLTPPQIVYKHYQRALSLWPKDRLRPDCQLQDVLLRRVNKTFLPTPAFSPETGEEVDAPAIDEARELEQVNALYSLLDGRYAGKVSQRRGERGMRADEIKYPPQSKLMKPTSNPEHYTNLLAELEAAPERSAWERIKNRLGGIFRLQ